MNENEAVERIKKDACNNRCIPQLCNDECMYGDTKCAFSVAIKALEEIQQYRAIGTVEECRAAVEKQKTRKPHKNVEKFGGVWCACGKYLGKGYFVDKPTYCSDCGQKIDWSDEE